MTLSVNMGETVTPWEFRVTGGGAGHRAGRGARGAPGTVPRRAPRAAGVPHGGLDQPAPHVGALARIIEDPALRLAHEGTFA